MKPTSIPEFSEGMHYRQLHPTREGARRWRFVTLRGIRLPMRDVCEHVICYHDKFGKVWARHDKFGLYVEPGYAWNGCSPKRWMPVVGWVGTPDFQSTRLASLCHDVAYQFQATRHFPLHRDQVDNTFYHCIAMAGDEELAGIYHGAVRAFGEWSSLVKDGEFSTLL